MAGFLARHKHRFVMALALMATAGALIYANFTATFSRSGFPGSNNRGMHFMYAYGFPLKSIFADESFDVLKWLSKPEAFRSYNAPEIDICTIVCNGFIAVYILFLIALLFRKGTERRSNLGNEQLPLSTVFALRFAVGSVLYLDFLGCGLQNRICERGEYLGGVCIITLTIVCIIKNIQRQCKRVDLKGLPLQIHLSTALAMQFTAAILLFFNVITGGSPRLFCEGGECCAATIHPEIMIVDALVVVQHVILVWYFCERAIQRRAQDFKSFEQPRRKICM